MKKYILIIISMVLLMSCSFEPSTSTKSNFIMPEGMKDCKVHYMSNGTTAFYVVHCPNATTTTYKGGKHSTNVTVIDQGVML